MTRTGEHARWQTRAHTVHHGAGGGARFCFLVALVPAGEALGDRLGVAAAGEAALFGMADGGLRVGRALYAAQDGRAVVSRDVSDIIRGRL